MVKEGYYKMAMVVAFCAFQLHILTMASPNGAYRLYSPFKSYNADRDNVVQAFIIIAYGCFIIGLILALTMAYCGKENSALTAIFAAIFLFIAAGSVIIHLAIYDDGVKPLYNSHTTTTYVTGAAGGVVSGLLLLMSLCC